MKHLAKFLSAALVILSVPFVSADLDKGDAVDSFVANDDSGELWSAAGHLGSQNMVVYFYPAAMTGGCTKQACAYRDFSSQLGDVDAMVVGVSGDSVKNLALFKEAHGLNFPLLSDPNGVLAKQFGVPTRDGGSIEREVGGSLQTLTRGLTTARWTFVIGKDGTVLYKKEDANPTEDTEEVLAVLKANA